MRSSSPRPVAAPKRLTGLTAAAAVLVLLSGCVVSGDTRDGSHSANADADRATAQDNAAAVTSAVRSYAIVDDETTPKLDIHLFGLPGTDSLAQATEKAVLGSVESAGAFGGHKAFDPVATDPSQRWETEEFTRSSDAAAPSAEPTSTTGAGASTDSASTAGTGLTMSNRVIAAGGAFLISALTQTDGQAAANAQGSSASETAAPSGTASPAPEQASTTVFVTNLAEDTTVDAAELFTSSVDAGTLSADETGTLRVGGKPVQSSDLSPLGTTVAKALHTPVELPSDADDRDPDFSCALLPCVALTYDDGPGAPEDEDRLLDAAKTAKIRLSYFLLGSNVKHHPEVVKRMADAGHEIANHTFNHPQLPHKSADQAKAEVDDTDKALEEACGGRSKLMRPPYGALNKSGAKAVGHPAIMWDVDTEDWRHRNRQMTVDAVANNAKPGSIVLMHSIHSTTIDAAADVFKTVADKGLYAVTVSDLFADQKLEKGAEYFCRGYRSELCSNPEHPAVRKN